MCSITSTKRKAGSANLGPAGEGRANKGVEALKGGLKGALRGGLKGCFKGFSGGSFWGTCRRACRGGFKGEKGGAGA